MRKMKFSRTPLNYQLKLLNEVAEERDAKRRALAEKLPYFKYDHPINKNALILIKEEVARSSSTAIIDKRGKTLVVVVYSLENKKTKDLLNSLKEQGYITKPFLASINSLRGVWDQYPNVSGGASEEIVSEIDLDENITEDLKGRIKKPNDAKKEIEKNRTEISETLKTIISCALILGVSDVHMEQVPKEGSLLRFRIDGILMDITKLKPDTTRQLVNRIKMLSNLKINVRNLPQDGRFTIHGVFGDIEARVSVMPAEFGEAIVIRMLDPKTIGMELKDIGFRKEDEDLIIEGLKSPNGMILITGPTGSGKTTTLYAFLKIIKDPTTKIITIEDPIEYHLNGIEQTQTDSENGYTFATGLRSVLRHDPDILLIGEIRDRETAETAIDAALTGHLVFSTLHTNNAAGAIPRLVDLGIKTKLISSAITFIIAQRLVRKLCTECRKKVKINKDLNSKIKKFIQGLPKQISRENIEARIYSASGCEKCIDGFRGRIAIAELLKITDNENVLISQNPSEKEIENYAIDKQRMLLMQQDGILKAIDGITTLEEIEKATGPIEW
jgi:type IV pilus assembly protein PilB